MMKRLLATILVLFMLLSFVSCNIGTNDNVVTTPADTDSIETTSPTVSDTTDTEDVVKIPEGILIAGPNVNKNVALVYENNADADLVKAVQQLRDYINKFNQSIVVTSYTETSMVESDVMILVGKVSCDEFPYPADDKATFGIVSSDRYIRVYAQNIDGYKQALSYIQGFSVNGDYIVFPENATYASNATLSVISHTPENTYYYEDVYTPDLSYTISDINSLAEDGFQLMINGKDYTQYAEISSSKVIARGFTVESGDYTAYLKLTDKAGNFSVYSNTFSCGNGDIMNLYSGEVHAHTSESDGQGTVLQAYEYARDVAKLDFFAVTDHSNSITQTEYTNIHIATADKLNDPGQYVTLYGFEQTYGQSTGYYGHLNTINSTRLTTRELPLYNYYKYNSSKNNIVTMFNHPGYTWGNFLEFEGRTDKFDSTVVLSEIKGKGYDEVYALSLSKGWHTSPMYNEDNHTPNWGNAYEYCGYALAPALTRANIVEAFFKNRTYTTTDKSLKVYYKVNDEWMGARLDNPSSLHITVNAETAKETGLGTLSIIAEDGIVVAYKAVGKNKKIDWELDLPADYDYYYVKITDGTNYCVTAPVWVENRDVLSIQKLDQELVAEEQTKSHRIYAYVKNNSKGTIENAKVEFYLGNATGISLARKITPKATTKIGDIAPGATVVPYADVPYSISSVRVYAIVTGTLDGTEYKAVMYSELAELMFTEIVPWTTGKEDDEYEFIELYNNSNNVIKLSDYSICCRPKPGAKSDEIANNTWQLSGEIQPHSAIVVWVRHNNALTLADFNKFYGTDLNSNQVIIVGGAALPQKYPVHIELRKGTTVIGRIWYNRDTGYNDVQANKAITFSYSMNYTFTQLPSQVKVTATPGTVSTGMPKIVNK